MRFTHKWRHLAPVMLLFTACESASVRWVDDTPRATGQPSPLAQSPLQPPDSSPRMVGDSLALFLETQALLRDAGALSLLESHFDSLELWDSSAAETASPSPSPSAFAALPQDSSALGADVAPRDEGRCVQSLRVASTEDRGTVAVWWTQRANGRVELVSATRAKPNGWWQGPVVVDAGDSSADESSGSGDASLLKCPLIAPSVALDANGAIHVAYSKTTSSGAGVFHAHQRNNAAKFESPQAIVYGDTPTVTRIASFGDVVAVVYEDPNGGAHSGIALAVSLSGGEQFDYRLEVTAATSGGRDPYVMLKGSSIVVGWSELSLTGTEPTFMIRRARIHF